MSLYSTPVEAVDPATNINIRSFQIYKPDGKEFGMPETAGQFSYVDIIHDKHSRDKYMEMLIREMTPVIKKIWNDKTGK